ncbi:MAG: preprotein translocase subunit SecG [Marinilabiliales bacterium]|nr:MAG: preprotein translocase subunit SecG [Marinilabiliales bacterium]
MFTLISVLIFIAAVLLVLIVLVQNSKGGGLAANFSASNQVMGVRKTADFLEKATWTLAASLVFLSIIASATIPRGEIEAERSLIEGQIENAIDPSALPTFPTSIPDLPTDMEALPADELPPFDEDPE